MSIPVGIFLEIPCADVVEMASLAGWDFVVIDTEHGPIGSAQLPDLLRAARYSLLPMEEYLRRPVRVVIQIETAGALAEVDAIAGLAGVDELFIGPYDLSQALGRPGDVMHADVLGAGQRVIHAAHAAGIAVSAFANSGEAADRWREMGVDRLYYSADVYLLAQAMRATREQMRSFDA